MPTEYRRIPNGFHGNQPRRIIVHCIAAEIDYQDARLDAVDFLRRIGLSYHAMVTPAGTLIHCREDNEGAYHAKGHNENTLGLGIQVPNAYNIAQLKERVQSAWLSADQFLTASQWVRDKMRRHEIDRDLVKRHSDLDPERRWYDPGPAFPWALFRAELTR